MQVGSLRIGEGLLALVVRGEASSSIHSGSVDWSEINWGNDQLEQVKNFCPTGQ